MVTRPTYMGGLGFDLKWNMGWMHDMLSYMEKDPIYRRYHQNQITFSLIYAFHENFILPFSHDEVVHLKRSMLDKMPGDVWQQVRQPARALRLHVRPSGQEAALHGRRIWPVDANGTRARVSTGICSNRRTTSSCTASCANLNQLYLSEPALHEIDGSWEGFEWIDLSRRRPVDHQLRAPRRPILANQIVVVCNFTPVPRLGYRVGLPLDGRYRGDPQQRRRALRRQRRRQS